MSSPKSFLSTQFGAISVSNFVSFFILPWLTSIKIILSGISKFRLFGIETYREVLLSKAMKVNLLNLKYY